MVAGQAHIALGVGHGGLEQVGVAWQRGGLEQQRRVGGSVDRLQAGNGIEVAGVSDHGGELLELCKLRSHERLCREGRGSMHWLSAAAVKRAVSRMSSRMPPKQGF